MPTLWTPSRDERPPVLPTFLGFRLMVLLGGVMLILTLMGVIYSMRGSLETHRLFLTIMLFSIPMPYIAGQLGRML